MNAEVLGAFKKLRETEAPTELAASIGSRVTPQVDGRSFYSERESSQQLDNAQGFILFVFVGE